MALADTGHFGKAAERTFVSQPTLSAQLKKLEEYLGVKLVERQPKNVQLTEVGKQVVVRARRMLDEGDEIVSLARNSTDPLAGKLKLALIPTIGPYLLPRIMQKIRKSLPHLGLMLYEHQTEPLLRRLRDGEIDLGIMALPICGWMGLETRELYEEAFTVALPNRPSTLAAKSSDQGAGSQGPNACCCSRMDTACAIRRSRSAAASTCKEAEDFRATSLETLRQMVIAGLGITLMPETGSRSPVRLAARAHHTAIQRSRRRPAPSAPYGGNRPRAARRYRRFATCLETVLSTVN